MFAYHQKQKANAEGVLTETSKRERGTFLSTLFLDGYGKVEFKVGRILQAVYYFMFFLNQGKLFCFTRHVLVK